MNSFRKIVILGHSGFIGQHLEAFLRNSYVKVIGQSLPDVDLTRWQSAEQLSSHLTRETSLILTAAVKRQFGDNLEAFHQNLAIVENVCRLLEKNPVKQVVFFSSAAVYGEETENISISEETPVNPTSFYGIAKYSGECLLRKTCIDRQINSLVCLRPPLIYGLGDLAKTYGPSGFCTAALAGQTIALWGDGMELREFIYIEDLCRIVTRLLDLDFFGALNIVSGASYSFADIVSILKQKFPDLRVNSRPRSREKANNAFNPTRIKSLLPPDFKFTSLEEGISKILG
ncbi:NAD-dependent epimerase/dehydratase family protein [Cylindrospermopsis raciborskii]|uniref:NAD-dependent epimerase/dehydratase family protein n=1 Tax=Cylindrospermopsis raciborskii TaxID=77022 RepID=UPI001BAA39DA|nr:NAD(P)-dependent oxidoreductase [Cylindrospermopsis raciborskii]